MKNHFFKILLAAILPVHFALAETVQINLTKKPEFSEEGIHISAKEGSYSMYAVNASPKIFKAFNQAKKGQCLELETNKGFDFNDASMIISVKPCPVMSIKDFSELERWRPEMKGSQFEASMNSIVAESSTHFVVFENAGTSCAAGNHWLFNKKLKSYRPVDSGTCDDRKFKVLLESDKLVFMSKNKVTAQYPL